MGDTSDERRSATIPVNAASVLLAVGVVGAVGMMIVPLPTWLLDLLLTMNVSVAAVLLLVSLTIPGIRALSSLPSLLLLTTLLRLALNVSTTRLILLDADAGRVIEAFGAFVVQGSAIVGAVVFLILTLIQFVVIAQGSERVAEVAARFSLDAMPGRQMAIDADLRSGAVGLKEAQRLRVELQRESQLYGAMDGAMKASVTPALENMAQAMSGLSEQLRGREFEGMEKIVENFRSSLSASIDDDLSRFAEALTVAADHQNQVSTDMETFFARLTEVGRAQTEMLERTNEVSGTFEDGLESLKYAQEAIRQVSTQVGEMMSSAAVLFEETRTQADSYREAAGSIHELLAGQLETTEAHVKGVFELWESFDDKLEGMSAKMSDSLSELVGFSAGKIREIFETFDTEMATVVEHLGGTLAELRVTTDDLPAASRQIATSVAEIPAVLTNASQGLHHLLEESQKATQHSVNHPSVLAGELDKVTKRTSEDLEAFSSELRKTTEQSAASLETLNASLPTISATSKDLAAAFERTESRLGSLQAELENLRKESESRGFLGLRRNS